MVKEEVLRPFERHLDEPLEMERRKDEKFSLRLIRLHRQLETLLIGAGGTEDVQYCLDEGSILMVVQGLE